VHITLVKKRLADGTLCPKCADVDDRIDRAGQRRAIHEVLIADEADPASPGARLAADLQVDRAPFFVVRDESGSRVYTSYFRFVKEVLGTASRPQDEAAELLNDHPELDLI
jgi:hypothetical protein